MGSRVGQRDGRTPWRIALACALLIVCWLSHTSHAADTSDYYRIITLPVPEGLQLEVSGMALLPGKDGRLAVSIRKGEVWIVENAYDDPPTNVRYKRFASGLHEPLGLLYHDGALYTMQRSELTRLRDVDGDDVADEYTTIVKSWGVSGNYHEYAYGPVLDRDGNFWFTLNATLGKGLDGYDKDRKWRGWSMMAKPSSTSATGYELSPVSAGLRSPSGVGMNADGEMFCTDQQGNWFGTCPLLHLKRGAFHGHADALQWCGESGATVKHPGALPSGIPFPEAVARVPGLTAPAVWFPYRKMGMGSTGFVCDNTGGRFGPWANQLLVGDFTMSLISRVTLEQVDGEYQGACYPFLKGFQSAVLRLCWGRDGSLFVGETNRGWNSLGDKSYGLQRVVWTGKTPFEIESMRAAHDGFTLTFTKPVDRGAASNIASYVMSSYTHTYQAAYGSPEIDTRKLTIRSATVGDDGRTVRLVVDPLRPLYVHELHADGVRSASGAPLLHAEAYYTLNRVPKTP